MIRDYKKIKAWQVADKLAVKVYETTRSYPKDEIYGLTSQIRRAAVSIAANIAEGSGRSTQKDYLHFLTIARSSAREVEYYIDLSYKLKYIGELRLRILTELCSETHRVLFGLIQAVTNDRVQSLACIVYSLLSIVSTLGGSYV